MKRILLPLALVPLGLWAFYVFPDLYAGDTGFWQWRRAAIVLIGMIALWWMSAGMVLAARPAWLEQRFGGLDKLYRLHKNIGIGAGILVFAHWMAEWLPKKLGKLGLLPPRVRGPKGPESLWMDLAKDIGEWAGYILLALVVIALIRRIPYRWFRLVHKAFGVVFLGGAFHGLMLLPKDFWQQPLGWLTAALALAGSVTAVLSLRGRIGEQRRHPAIIAALRQPEAGVLEVVCRTGGTWPGHRAGQFLFADFGKRAEGAHPFTIASAWNAQDGQITLAIKALGDYTRTLARSLAIGQPIQLEGPYGKFDFCPSGTVDRDNRPIPQIWVAGGIGITPFLARIDELAQNGRPETLRAHLFYSTPAPTPFPENLEARCAAAGVQLHHYISQRDGLLTPESIGARLQPGSSVWFCGPANWGRSLREALVAHGLARRAFHQEAFEFR